MEHGTPLTLTYQLATNIRNWPSSRRPMKSVSKSENKPFINVQSDDEQQTSTTTTRGRGWRWRSQINIVCDHQLCDRLLLLLLRLYSGLNLSVCHLLSNHSNPSMLNVPLSPNRTRNATSPRCRHVTEAGPWAFADSENCKHAKITSTKLKAPRSEMRRHKTTMALLVLCHFPPTEFC